MKSKKEVDISELYDYIKRKNCYFVGVDMKCLIPINEILRYAQLFSTLQGKLDQGKHAD